MQKTKELKIENGKLKEVKTIPQDIFTFCGRFRELQNSLARKVIIQGGKVSKDGNLVTVVVVPDSINLIISKKLVTAFHSKVPPSVITESMLCEYLAQNPLPIVKKSIYIQGSYGKNMIEKHFKKSSEN
jgi:hypothetical protein